MRRRASITFHLRDAASNAMRVRACRAATGARQENAICRAREKCYTFSLTLLKTRAQMSIAQRRTPQRAHDRDPHASRASA